MADRNEWANQLAIIIAQARWGSRTPDMGGRDNPRPVETSVAVRFLDDLKQDGYAKVSADPDTVERVAEAIHAESCGCNAQSGALVGEWHQLARAAINAIGGSE